MKRLSNALGHKAGGFKADFDDLVDQTQKEYAPQSLEQTHWYRRLDFAVLNGATCESLSNTVKISVFNPWKKYSIIGILLSSQISIERWF